MIMKTICALMATVALALPAIAGFDVQSRGGRIEIHDDGKRVFGWQSELIKDPKGGEGFAASAFLHPLCPPSGFELTAIQPDDHLHHLGVWWPWKMLTVDGKDYVTWEMQQKQGQHLAMTAKVVSCAADRVEIEASNRTLIRPDGGEGKAALAEQVHLSFFRLGGDAYGLDIRITQRPVAATEVTVKRYRYSGFSWRGTGTWNKDNSVMHTSGGHHRDNANHQPANWVMVGGKTPDGCATMLLMSGAAKQGVQAERLRVWGSNMHDGMPFVNFNPVVKESLSMKPEDPRVADRRYRLILADRAIPAAEADRMWAAWQVD